MASDTFTRGRDGGGMGGHHAPVKGAKDEWITPPFITQALGPFDLDPCAPVDAPWPIAQRTWTVLDDGLSRPWDGFVWCNPPYGPQTWRWLDRLAHHDRGGVALIFARTETAGFFAQVWAKADALLFLEGRLYFHHVTGERAGANAGAPSVLVAYGAEAVHRIRTAHQTGAIRGHLVADVRAKTEED